MVPEYLQWGLRLFGRASLSAIYNDLKNWQNKPLVAHYGHDPVQLFFAKALANVMVACSAVLIFFTIGILFLAEAKMPFSSKMWTAGINSILVSIFFMAYYQIRNGNYSAARLMFVGSSVSGIVFAIFATGGFPQSEVSQTIIVVPVLVYLFYGMRAGTLIAALSPLVLVLQWWFVHLTNVQFPNISADNDPFLKMLLPTLIVYVLLIVIVAGYEYRQSILHRELKEERERLRELTQQDGLTGVANSRFLHERLKSYNKSEQSDGQRLAMLYLDLDDFKAINDAHGHLVGDRVLKTVAQRLADCARDCDFVARVGGDEFVVVLHHDVDSENIADIMARLDRLFTIPIDCEGVICRVGASVGIAVYPDEVASPMDLLDRADQQMYAIKKVHTKQRLLAKRLYPSVGSAHLNDGQSDSEPIARGV